MSIPVLLRQRQACQPKEQAAQAVSQLAGKWHQRNPEELIVAALVGEHRCYTVGGVGENGCCSDSGAVRVIKLELKSRGPSGNSRHSLSPDGVI